MKSEKGITLISLTLYLMVMVFVMAIIMYVSGFFHTNVTGIKEQSKETSEFTKFNSFFIEEVKKEGNSILYVSHDKKYIIFSSDNRFTFRNNAIYLNNQSICGNVEYAAFQSTETGGKVEIKVIIQFQNGFSRTMEYYM